MAWTDWIPLIIGGVSAAADYKSAKSPDVPEALDYRQILNLIMQNSNSPFGSTTYEEGPNGRITRNMQFSPQVQPAFDRLAYRAANPDQAYQLPPQLQQLQQALMNQRLQRMGITPQTGGGGGQSQPNFNYPGPIGPGQTLPYYLDEPARNQDTTQSNSDSVDYRTSEGGNRGARDSGYTPGLDPRYGPNASQGQISDETLEWLEKWFGNKLISGAAGQLLPGAGSAMSGLAWLAGNTLDNRAGTRLSDFNNQMWGSYDNPTQPTDAYFQTLLGYNPYRQVNPDTGAALGEAGGMPGAQHSQAELDAMYGGRTRQTMMGDPIPIDRQRGLTGNGAGFTGISRNGAWTIGAPTSGGSGDLRFFFRPHGY